MVQRIPVYEPLFQGNELKYLEECISSGWISSSSPFVSRFEEAFASSVSRAYGVTVANGSVALDLALQLLDLRPGDEVLIPAFTIISPVSAILRAGATPVLVDVEPDHWNVDVEQILEKITPRTKAILAVHIYGLPCEIVSLERICRERGILLIEDAAEMHGQSCSGRQCGSFGDVSTFSFYANKLISMGEGGICLTGREDLAERLRSLRNLAFGKESRFRHEELGWNYRLSGLQAAVGLAQLERINEFIAIKRRLGARYQELLKGVPEFQTPLEQTSWAENIYWVFGVLLRPNREHTVQSVRARLAQDGIETREFFLPMHQQPVFRQMGLFTEERHPVAERLAREGFYIPMGLTLTEEQQVHICEKMISAVRA